MSLMLLGLCAVTRSAVMFIAFLVTSISVGIRTRREERHLLTSHGDDYRTYASKVGRFVPGLGRSFRCHSCSSC